MNKFPFLEQEVNQIIRNFPNLKVKLLDYTVVFHKMSVGNSCSCNPTFSSEVCDHMKGCFCKKECMCMVVPYFLTNQPLLFFYKIGKSQFLVVHVRGDQVGGVGDLKTLCKTISCSVLRGSESPEGFSTLALRSRVA